MFAGCGRIGFEPARDGVTAGDGATSDDGGTDAPRSPLEAGACPQGYMARADTCYRANGNARSWRDAEADCEDDAVGAHLVVISTAAEAQTLRTILDDTEDYWIGSVDIVAEGVYVGVTGMPAVYLRWGTAEPDGGVEDCLYFEDGDINDDECVAVFAYLCEYDGVAADPATYN